jgi:soluble lytic murein transglycosylase-like protein
MFVAVWRYSLALSLALGAGLLAQPALARGHHHVAYARMAHHDVRIYGHRHAAFMMAAAPQAWSEAGASSMPSPQNYWQHGWRGHMARQTALRQNDWQQNGWQNSWQQNSWQQNGESARQRRLAQRQQSAFSNSAAPGFAPTYYDYAPQSSWSSSNGGFGGHSALSGMIAQAASSAGVPVSLAERVVRRESGGNPRAVHAGNYGLMQIRLGTARAMGYGGSAAGLLDPSVNMTYAMRYLAGAYRAAGGSESRAVALYARGYHATPARVQTYTF